MNQVVILALIAALQQEVVLLEQELAQQQAIVSPVPYSPYLGSVPTIGTNGGDVAPTSSPVNGLPINYVDTDTSVQSCSITASVRTAIMVGETNPYPLTTIDWSLGGMPTSTQGFFTPIDSSYGIFSTNASPDDGKLETVYWGYFPGGIKATFGSSTCKTYFPDESPSVFGIPSTTVYSTNNS